MASTTEVLTSPTLRSLRTSHPLSSLSFPVLVPNARGLSSYLSLLDSTPSGTEPITDELAVFISASEGFSRANLNCSIADSVKALPPIFEAAKERGLRVRAYVSVVLGCPFDGRVDQGQVARLAEELVAMGAYEISLGDTIGVGTPRGWDELLVEVTKKVPVEKLAVS